MSNKPKLGGTLIALWAFFITHPALLFVAACAVLVASSRPAVMRIEHAFSSTPALSGMTSPAPDAFRAVGSAQTQHMLAFATVLAPHTVYDIRFHVDQGVTGSGPLVVDLYGPNYDDPAQERQFSLDELRTGSTIQLKLDSGDAPARANLRIFYTGPPGLQISRVQFTRDLGSLWWLRVFAATIALGAAIVVASRLRARAHSYVSASSRDRGRTPEAIAIVMTIWLGAALLHYGSYLLTPYWSGDEFIYRSIAAAIWQFGRMGQLTPDAIADGFDFPNLLYPHLIAPAFALQENFYSGIRLINAVIMSGASIPAFLIASRYLGARSSILLSAFAVAIPFMWLGSYAVTEVVFYPVLLWTAWIALRCLDRPTVWGNNIALGALSAVLVNIRPNGFVVLVAYSATLVLLAIRRGELRDLVGAPAWISALATFVVGAVCLQAVLGVVHVGSFGTYGTLLARTGSTQANGPYDYVRHLLGHVATLAVPYALPAGIVIAAVLPAKSGRQSLAAGTENLLCFALVLLLAMIGVTVAFTLRIAPFDLGGLTRIHARYYFPASILLLVAAVVVTKDRASGVRAAVVIAAAMLLANIAYVQVADAIHDEWFGSLADNMEMHWYRTVPNLYWAVIGTYVAFLAYWASGRAAWPYLTTALLGAYVALANYGTAAIVLFGAPITHLECGRLVADYLRVRPGAYAVIADSRANKVGVVFWTPTLPVRTLMAGSSLKLESLSQEVEYVVVNGSSVVDEPWLNLVMKAGQCRLYAVIAAH